MSPFWLLLLAHIISDFPLQTDRIYQIKKKYVWGVFLHVGVCTVINIIFLIPYIGNWQIWAIIVFLFFVHAILDRSKIVLTARWFKDGVLYFFADQMMHVTTIWIASTILFDWSQFTPTLTIFPSFYENVPLQIILSGLIFAIFGGAPIDYYVLISYYRYRSDNPILKIAFPSFLQRIPGYFERFLATFGIILGGIYYLFLPFALVPHYMLRKNQVEPDSVKYRFVVNIFLSILVGISVRIILSSRLI